MAKPIYLKYIDRERNITAFVCLISFQLAGVKCAALVDGPVVFGEHGRSEEAGNALIGWFRSHGYAFIRMSHTDPSAINLFASAPEAVVENPLPFIPRYGAECVMDLQADDSTMLAGFQRDARKNIRRACKAGCVVRRSSEFKDFQKLWGLFTNRAREKGFRFGNLKRYEDIFALGARDGLVRLYTAYYNEQPIYPVMVLRGHAEAYGLIAALDTKALGEYPSPCCLVQWTIMREYRDLGCLQYNIGQPTGGVYTFKQKFHPVKTAPPATVTLVLRQTLYRIWTRVIIPLANTGFHVRNKLRKWAQ